MSWMKNHNKLTCDYFMIRINPSLQYTDDTSNTTMRGLYYVNLQGICFTGKQDE